MHALRTIARSTFAVAIGAATTLLAPPARAAPSARLVYLRSADTASCPDETAVRSAVAARLGYDPFLAQARATMLAEVRREGKTYKVSIKLVDDASVVRGARELTHEGEPCSELVDLMALTMSIAIDPLSLAGPRSAPETSDPPSPPEPPPEPTPAPAPPPSAPRRALAPAPRPVASGPEVHLDALLGVGFGAGLAPSPSVGARLGAMLHVGAFAPFVEGRADLPSSASFGRGSVGTTLVGVSLGACYAWRFLFGCGLGSLGALTATSEGITAPRSETAIHGALGARAGAEARLAPSLALRGQLEGLAILTPHALVLDGVEVSRLSIVSISGIFFVSARFF